MASSRNKAWGSTQPSTAFLIKCAKEKEKLKSTLQKQLQDHMLHMLQECMFSDILIGVNTKKNFHNENTSKHLDLPQLVRAHKPVLKVRTPAFYDSLEKNKESHLGISSCNSYLDELELQYFLRNIYTDDDIRRHECEALRMSRMYLEILSQNKGPVNKHIPDIDEFEKESATSSCTDNFVTPKTSPVSPEKRLESSEMFNATRVYTNETNMKQSQSNPGSKSSSLHSKNVEDIETNTMNFTECTNSETGSYDRELSNKMSNIGYSNPTDNLISHKSEDEDHAYEPLLDDTDDNDSDDENSEPDDLSNIGSMVRSNTFDLQTQGSLDDVTDEELLWCSGHQVEEDYKIENNQNFDTESEVVSNKRSGSNGFFLHDHTPSPKSNLFKHGFVKEVSFNSNHEVDNSVGGVHFRRIDGSMSDSGFMSHSTFSLLSDAGLASSTSSSLIIPVDGNLSPSTRSTSTGNDVLSSENDSSKRHSGSMFPFYIDINNLPTGASDTKKEKKSSPSHTYMYIDARSKINIENCNELNNKEKKKFPVNSSYEAFFSELEAGFKNKNQEPLMKASSTPHLDFCKDSRPDSGKSGRKSRPQSCYMYIDLDSIQDNKSCPKKILNKQTPSSVAMFIDLNEASDKNNFSDGKQAVKHDSENHILTNFSKIKYMQENNKTTMESFVRPSNQAVDHKRKLSDSSATDSLEHFSTNLRSHSLTRNREIRSASALDYRIVNFQEIAAQSKISSQTEKSHLMHRYSDGIFFDNSVKSANNYAFSQLKNTSDVSKTVQVKETKLLNSKLQLLAKNEDPSGSCSNLGKVNDYLLSDDKVKWKSTGDMGQPKDCEGGLLPMSPILRRKVQPKSTPKSAPPPVVVKASTKPQDIDAMTFPKSLIEDAPSLKLLQNSSKENISTESVISTQLVPMDRKQTEDTPNSSSSIKNGYEILQSNESKKHADSLSRSGSSVMTLSGGDTSSSDKNLTHEISKEKIIKSDSVSRSGSSVMSMSGGDTSSDRNVNYEALRDKFNHSAVSYDLEDDSETIYSEVSDVSSSLGGIGGIASLERQWRERQHADSDSTNHNLENSRRMLEACSKLGEDLLRMYLEEIDTDITIEVAGHEIKAHRCILVSRCKYFAGLLRGSDSRKNCSTISLEGFSQTSVHFALCHIYSGAMNIPQDCNISELSLLADMLNLDSLTDVIVFHLKMHFCHFFHRPCPQCVQGVVECLPLAAVCGLNELRDKCIFWLGKYFTRTWPNKSFAALSEELRNLCYNVTVHHLAINTVMDMTLNCDRLMTTLPQLKWTEPIFGMITKLLQDCIHFIAKNFSQILCSEGFLALGKGQSWNITALEEDLISAVELTTPDIACKSYAKVNQLLLFAESDENSDCGEFTQKFVDLLHKISRHCERYLIQNANKVAHCQSWACLDAQVQKRIKDAAVIVFEFEKPTAPPPRLSSLQRKLKKQNDAEEMACFERSTYPKKGRSTHTKKIHKDPNSSPKNSNAQNNCDIPDVTLYQRREMENLIKKIVSPIKEEHSASIDQSVKDFSRDRVSGALSEYESPLGSLVSHNRGFVDLHEEDSLRDLQDLPRDYSHSPSHHLRSVEPHAVHDGIALGVENHSSAHCSDNNPDSLEANEDLSLDAKGETSLTSNDLNHSMDTFSVEAKDASNKSPDLKSKLSLSAQDGRVPISFTTPSLENEKCAQNQVKCDRSPVKKSLVKSFVPLAKVNNGDEKKSPESRTKDLVAEIDADSRMVNHCLQEAEMLEQQLSRKLQRQQQDRSPNHYTKKSPVEHHKSSRISGSRLQKASSTSQIRNLASVSVGVRSPCRVSKSTASSPSMGHAPRLLRTVDVAKEQKIPQRKVLLSPKNNVTSSQRSFRSMENMAGVHRQLSIAAQLPSKQSSRSSRTKMPNASARTSVPNGK